MVGDLEIVAGPPADATRRAEQLPAGVRSTGIAISYNVAVMVFGGFAQFIVIWLGEVTGSPIAPAYYCIAGVAAGLVAMRSPSPSNAPRYSPPSVASMREGIAHCLRRPSGSAKVSR